MFFFMTNIRFQLHEGCKLYEEVNSGLYILVNLFLSTAWLVARYQAANNLSLSKRNFRIYYDTSGPAKAKIKHNHKQVKFNGWYLADQLLAQSVWSFWWHQLEFNRSDPSRRILLVRGEREWLLRVREREGNWKSPFPKFRNGKGIEKAHSRNSGTERE